MNYQIEMAEVLIRLAMELLRKQTTIKSDLPSQIDYAEEEVLWLCDSVRSIGREHRNERAH